MQAWPLIASGTAWSKGSGKRSAWHQQSTSKEPAACVFQPIVDAISG
jgi:hypothetical protein